ncbi:MAG TPA: serine O-acetyltransferase [Kiritimatiellia bacterium]|nr:serine O-acetyltransferase [Kiritimatiellia bacterium]HMO99405.1 serine O-acetyltransferase [Kiritimatiellia bacterium]HMP97950.1 serine O-acetyltransferase [Kiritimatiellia bacterium]
MVKKIKPLKRMAGLKLQEEVVDSLLLMFHDDGGDRPDGLMLGYPNPKRVVEALQLFLDVILPGKFDTEALELKKPLKAFLKDKMTKGAAILEKEVVKAIPFRWKGEAACVEGKRCPKIDVAGESHAVMADFCWRLPEVRRLVIQDIRAAYRGDPAALTYAEVKLAYPGLLAVATHRLAHELYKLNVPLVPRIMSEWTHARTGVDINPGARIGEGFFIDHATGVVIGETTEIGNHVKIYQGVTLGARSFALDENGNPIKHIKRHPTVEDNVVIYANATILGGDTVIGKGSVIGGNVFLMESVPPNSFVAAKHAELHIRRGDGAG